MAAGDLMVFAVYDSKTELYSENPIFSPTEASAVRAFAAAISDENHEFSKFSEDFSLALVGEWYRSKGELACCPPKIIATAWTIKAALKNNGSV